MNLQKVINRLKDAKPKYIKLPKRKTTDETIDEFVKRSKKRPKI